jgi:hypothetical protein
MQIDYIDGKNWSSPEFTSWLENISTAKGIVLVTIPHDKVKKKTPI